MKKILLNIAENFNRDNINWAIGASYLLKIHNIVDTANDLDILVVKTDFKKAASLLDRIGQKEKAEKKQKYFSNEFYKYQVDGVEVDLFVDLVLNYNNSFLNYQFKKESITEYKKINRVQIPLASLEDWYILYSLMPDKENKIKLLEDYFKQHGVKKPEIFHKILKEDLPNELKKRINRFL